MSAPGRCGIIDGWHGPSSSSTTTPTFALGPPNCWRRRATRCWERAPTLGSALTAIRALRPDVVLLDVQLPDLDGFAVLAELDALRQRPTVVLISTREAADYGGRIGRSGAAGFITKAELSVQSLAEVVAGR